MRYNQVHVFSKGETLALAGAAPAQGYGGYSNYDDYAGYGGHAWGTFCLPPLPPLAYLPTPSLPGAPADVDGQIDQKLKDLQDLLDKLQKRLKKLDAKQQGAEEAIKTLAGMQDDMDRAMERKLADLNILSRTLELKIAEESLRQKTEALAERTRAADAADKQRQEMARLEAGLRILEKKPAHDTMARNLIRDLEQQVAALDALMKTKLDVIEDHLGELAKKAQEDRLRQHFSRLDQRMRHIEDHFQQGQKAEEKTGIPANRALLTVSLPAGAKLYVNEEPTKGDSASRSFLTPELKAGTTYSYTLRMEIMHNGVMTSRSQQVYFRAGKEAHATFEPNAASAIRPVILP